MVIRVEEVLPSSRGRSDVRVLTLGEGSGQYILAKMPTDKQLPQHRKGGKVKEALSRTEASALAGQAGLAAWHALALMALGADVLAAAWAQPLVSARGWHDAILSAQEGLAAAAGRAGVASIPRLSHLVCREGNYLFPWTFRVGALCRSQNLRRPDVEGCPGLQGVDRVSVREFGAMFPDQKKWLSRLGQQSYSTSVARMLRCLDYRGPPELLSMWLCLFGDADLQVGPDWVRAHVEELVRYATEHRQRHGLWPHAANAIMAVLRAQARGCPDVQTSLEAPRQPQGRARPRRPSAAAASTPAPASACGSRDVPPDAAPQAPEVLALPYFPRLRLRGKRAFQDLWKRPPGPSSDVAAAMAAAEGCEAAAVAGDASGADADQEVHQAGGGAEPSDASSEASDPDYYEEDRARAAGCSCAFPSPPAGWGSAATGSAPWSSPQFYWLDVFGETAEKRAEGQEIAESCGGQFLNTKSVDGASARRYQFQTACARRIAAERLHRGGFTTGRPHVIRTHLRRRLEVEAAPPDVQTFPVATSELVQQARRIVAEIKGLGSAVAEAHSEAEICYHIRAPEPPAPCSSPPPQVLEASDSVEGASSAGSSSPPENLVSHGAAAFYLRVDEFNRRVQQRAAAAAAAAYEVLTPTEVDSSTDVEMEPRPVAARPDVQTS